MIRTRKSYSDGLKERGLRLACNGNIRKVNDSYYLVRSDSALRSYGVAWDSQSWRCQCRFNSDRHGTCEHIYAVVFARVLNPIEEGEGVCPDCGSNDLIRKGIRNNKSSTAQRYHCSNCGLNFTDRPAFYKMKGNARSIIAAMDLFFKGLSLSKIQDHLRALYGVTISRVGIYNWIRKYIELIDLYASTLHPDVGKNWNADETKLNVNGRHELLWNLLDSTTRFLIASQLTLRRRGKEAKRLIEKAISRARMQPTALTTDGLTSYDTALGEIQPENGKRIKHVANVALKDGANNLIESFHGTLKDRSKVMRGFDNGISAQRFAKGYSNYYNFVRPHLALDGRTPADAAGIGLGNEDNRWMLLIKKAKKQRSRRRQKPS